MQRKYRLNVGLMIVNDEHKIWLGERVGSEKFAYKFQMPQGGIDEHETPIMAAYRELYEETGLSKDKVELVAESKKWHTYDFPHPLKYENTLFYGQQQKWFLFRFKGEDKDFNLTAHPEEIEFLSFKWCSIESVLKQVVPFKKDIYSVVINEFKRFI